MFDNDNEKIEMHDVYDQIWEKVNELSNTGSDTLVIAGTLMAQAVRIYKSVLEPEEVEKLIPPLSNILKSFIKRNHRIGYC